LPHINKLYKYMGWINNVFRFYYEGFRNMTLGKSLWLIILVKLFVFFFIMKLFFFPNLLKKKFENDQQRGNYVLEQLTDTK